MAGRDPDSSPARACLVAAGIVGGQCGHWVWGSRARASVQYVGANAQRGVALRAFRELPSPAASPRENKACLPPGRCKITFNVNKGRSCRQPGAHTNRDHTATKRCSKTGEKKPYTAFKTDARSRAAARGGACRRLPEREGKRGGGKRTLNSYECLSGRSGQRGPLERAKKSEAGPLATADAWGHKCNIRRGRSFHENTQRGFRPG